MSDAEERHDRILEMLSEAPDPALIHAPVEFVEVPYLPGACVIFELNRIFGPDGWGFRLDAEPELVPMSGNVGAHICRGTVWFNFGTETYYRPARGVCPLRPKKGTALEQAPLERWRMSYSGSITEMIKDAATPLGPRLGLGLNEDLLRAKVGIEVPTAPQSGRRRGKGRRSKQDKPGWNEKQVKGFLAGMHARGHTDAFIVSALGIKGIDRIADYTGTINDAFTAVKEAENDAIAGKEGEE